MKTPTKLELEALRMRADGLSNHDIADELVITVDAVKRRLWRASAKLNARNTAHAVAQCYRLGLLELEVFDAS